MRWLLLFLIGCSSTGNRTNGNHSLDGFLEGDKHDLAGVTDLATQPDLQMMMSTAVIDMASSDLASIAGMGLDPMLGPADGTGQPCNTPGSLVECPGYAVCRFYTSTELRCDPANMNNPGVGGFCDKSSDCDLQYLCYRGFCFPFCELGGTDCGYPDDCVDVGYIGSTNIGACRD